jgi:hypothetical protein
MATIVFSTIGAIYGGPQGASIGRSLGQVVDKEIFGRGPAKEGPRLKELDVQTSSYGSNIPAVYGVMRVAGTVIWATDLIEKRNKSSGGKGKPANIDYTYSVNMAVALSSRPAASVGRIWADGNLLRGAAGDFKVPVQFRFHDGHDDQTPDSIIASNEGAENSPAYRGLCYAVFEEFQLAEYGNRIPSLSFELFERDGGVLLCDIVADNGAGLIDCDSDEQMTGYALEGRDARAALAPLLGVMPVIMRPRKDRLEINDLWSSRLANTIIIPAASANGKAYDPPQRQKDSIAGVPEALSIRHYEQARDFQIGIQRSQRSDTGRTAVQIDLPVTLNSGAALRLADLKLLQYQKQRNGWRGHVLRAAQPIYAGDWIVGEDNEKWQVIEIEHKGQVSQITARKTLSADVTGIAAADAGRSLSSPDMPAGSTKIILLDLPIIGTSDPAKPIIAVAAGGSSPAWRRAALYIRQGQSLNDSGFTERAALIGALHAPVTIHSSYTIDYDNRITVNMLNSQAPINSIDGDPADLSAPILWVNGELIRAGKSEYLGSGRYQFSRLIRGCYGTDNKIALHTIGSDVVILESETLRFIDQPLSATGSSLVVEAIGLGDDLPVSDNIIVESIATLPLAPVHGIHRRAANGDIKLSWIRRPRIDFGWQDGVDAPLVEGNESYSVHLLQSGAVKATWQIAVPNILVTTPELTALAIASNSTIQFEIRQIGTYGLSAPLLIGVTT